MPADSTNAFSVDIWRDNGCQRSTHVAGVHDFESVCAAAQVMSRPSFGTDFTAVRRGDGTVVIVYRDGKPAPLEDYLRYEDLASPGPLYKTVIVIWSPYDGQETTLSELARDAETGSACCSVQRSVLVSDPVRDPDWEPYIRYTAPSSDETGCSGDTAAGPGGQQLSG